MEVGLDLRLPRREGSNIYVLSTPADLQGQRIKALPLNFLHFDPSLSVSLPHLPNHCVPGCCWFFFFFLLCLTACGILVSQLGLNLYLLHLKCGVLTTGQQGKPLNAKLLTQCPWFHILHSLKGFRLALLHIPPTSF